VNWLLGELDRVEEPSAEAAARARQTGHVPTLTNVECFRVVLQMLRGDAEAALRIAEPLLELTRQHGLLEYATLATFHSTWARARIGEGKEGAAKVRQAIAACVDHGTKIYLPLHRGLLAELEAEIDGAEVALPQIDGALALAAETGEHWTDALLHRIRGEILLKRDGANTAPAEDAFLTAIAVAQQQQAKSFELQAALGLAKLYQSSNRPADGCAVLVPALAGFAPAPEFPEIEEAQKLLAALAKADEVKSAQ
jgi:predicted ATPase